MKLVTTVLKPFINTQYKLVSVNIKLNEQRVLH